jgi:integration host factor subunit alpha
VVRGKNARKGRNPQTGQEILLEARRVLTFKPSLVLKTILNDGEAGEMSAADSSEG